MSKTITTAWNHKDLLGLENLSASEIELILDRASLLKLAKFPKGGEEVLSASFVALLFLEPSTRTRISFEIAAKRLGGETLVFSASASSLTKGETLLDTVKNIEAMGVEFFVIRHSEAGVLEDLSPKIKASIINAGDGAHEHPSQALLDLLTLKEKKGKIRGLKVVIIGDILHSRVARSNIYGLNKLGAKVILCGPSSLLPKEFLRLGVEVSHDLDAALKNADAVNVLRLQIERQNQNYIASLPDYFESFGLTEARLKSNAAPGCVVLHPGPLNRGVEIDSELADGSRSLVLNQVQNGVFIRMAVFSLIKEWRRGNPNLG
jgi:aspartate carbamoyltransferase catalytic subunit